MTARLLRHEMVESRCPCIAQSARSKSRSLGEARRRGSGSTRTDAGASQGDFDSLLAARTKRRTLWTLVAIVIGSKSVSQLSDSILPGR